MLLGLDLASRLNGWCCGAGWEVPECGTWEFPPIKGDYGLLLGTLEDYLDVAFQRFRPTAVAYEAPILISGKYGQRADKLTTLRLLYPMGAFVSWYARKAGVPCHEFTVQEVKKEVTGNHTASKDDMVAIARKCGLALPAGEAAKDAADAFGVWLLLLRKSNRDLSARWDKKIWGPRGALL